MFCKDVSSFLSELNPVKCAGSKQTLTLFMKTLDILLTYYNIKTAEIDYTDLYLYQICYYSAYFYFKYCKKKKKTFFFDFLPQKNKGQVKERSVASGHPRTGRKMVK